MALAHQHRHGLAAEALDELARGHAEGAVERVDGAALRRRQPVFARGHGIGPHDLLHVFDDDDRRGAKDRQFLVGHGQRVVEIGAGEGAEHAALHVVEPGADLGHGRDRGAAEAEPEPRPRRRGEARHQARGQRARGQHGGGIEQAAVALAAAIGPVPDAEEVAAARHDVVGKLAPVREPGGTLAVERVQPPLAMAAEF